MRFSQTAVHVFMPYLSPALGFGAYGFVIWAVGVSRAYRLDCKAFRGRDGALEP